jgi:hypothetical protein
LIFLGSICVWTQGLALAKQAIYHLSHGPSPKQHLYTSNTQLGNKIYQKYHLQWWEIFRILAYL